MGRAVHVGHFFGGISSGRPGSYRNVARRQLAGALWRDVRYDSAAAECFFGSVRVGGHDSKRSHRSPMPACGRHLRASPSVNRERVPILGLVETQPLGGRIVAFGDSGFADSSQTRGKVVC